MKKRNAKILFTVVVMLAVVCLWSAPGDFQVMLTAGPSIVYSEDNPNSFYYEKNHFETSNYGVILKWKQHLVDFNYKEFDNNPKILSCEWSNDITGKDFFVYSLQYGREIYSVQGFDFNAFAGVGYLKRKVNRDKRGLSQTDKTITLPLKLSINKTIFHIFGISVSAFSNLNTTETISGFDFNFFIRLPR